MTDILEKFDWEGEITSIQPRIRLHRSFDELSHSYLGYVLQIEGKINGEERDFSVAVGKGAQTKHAFQVGDYVIGACSTVENNNKETAEYYKASRLKAIARSQVSCEPPPWQECHLTWKHTVLVGIDVWMQEHTAHDVGHVSGVVACLWK